LPRPGQHEIDLLAAALRAFELPGPIAQRQFTAVASSVLGRVGVELVLAVAAPDDQPSLCHHRRAAERSRRPAIPVHR